MAGPGNFHECEACSCFAVRRAARAITQLYDRHLRGTGLRANQFTLLVVLARAGDPLPMGRLASLLGVERTTLTRNLRPLEAQRFVAMRTGDDHRVRRVALTERGRAAALAALPAWRKAQSSVGEQVDNEMLHALARLGRRA
jgi:DNA-binding MarR family transcriptional regulator